jgi:hypothetical protein
MLIHELKDVKLFFWGNLKFCGFFLGKVLEVFRWFSDLNFRVFRLFQQIIYRILGLLKLNFQEEVF